MNNQSTNASHGLATILRLLLGDPRTRVPKLLVTIGAGALLSQWWLPLIYALAIKYFDLPRDLFEKTEFTSFCIGATFVALGLAGWIWQMQSTSGAPVNSGPEASPPVEVQRPNPDGRFGTFKVLPENDSGAPHGDAETPDLAIRLAKLFANQHKTSYRVYLMRDDGGFSQDLGIFNPD